MLARLEQIIGNQTVVIATDVDGTIDRLCGYAHSERVKSLCDAYNKVASGLFMPVTGRSVEAAENLGLGQWPGVFEHGAVMRTVQGGDLKFNAPQLNADYIKDILEPVSKSILEYYGFGRVTVSNEAFIEDKKQPLYLQIKQASMGLGSQMHNGKPVHDKDQMEKALRQIFHVAASSPESGITYETHGIQAGLDFVEILPNEVNKISGFQSIFKIDPKQRVALPIQTAELIVYAGDSSSDAKLMEHLYERQMGVGIAVGNNIPYAPYIALRVQSVDEMLSLFEGVHLTVAANWQARSESSLLPMQNRKSQAEMPRALTLS